MLRQINLSIIIVNYNVRELIINCLNSINNDNSLVDFEIIIVDNNSSDGSVEYIKQNYKKIILIENKFNTGFSYANNQGISIARGEYILLLNPDTEIISDAISKMITLIKSSDDIALVAPKLLNTDKSIQSSVWKFPKYYYILIDIFFLNYFFKAGSYKINTFQKPIDIESVSGAAMLFRYELISKIGGLDENLFWMEDVDFCYRISKLNKKIIYYPDAIIVHHTGQCTKQNYKIPISNQILSKIKYFKKYKSKFIHIIETILMIIYVLIRIFCFLLFAPFGKIYRKKLEAYIFTLLKIFQLNFNIITG